MICGTLLWISLASEALGFIDSSDLADQLLEFARPAIKRGGDDVISIPDFETNVTDLFGDNMGTLSCRNGTLSDLSTIVRAGPAIMSKAVLKEDVVLSLRVSAKLNPMTLEFKSCDLSILDYPVKNVQPNITVGSNEFTVVLSVSGIGADCSSNVQKSTINLFADVVVNTGADGANMVTDGFLSGLVEGNGYEFKEGFQKRINTGLGKALNDATICDIFAAKKYLG